MRNDARLNGLWFSFHRAMEFYLKVSRNPNHSEEKKQFLLADAIEKGTPFIIEAQSNRNYIGLLIKAKKFFNQVLNSKRNIMKHFTLEMLLALTVMPETRAEVDELVEDLFNDYKNVAARVHLAETPAEGDVELRDAIGTKALEVANHANTTFGTDWRTTLPTIEECFSVENDDNKQHAETPVAAQAEEAPALATAVVEEEVSLIETKEQLQAFNDSVKENILAERKEEELAKSSAGEPDTAAAIAAAAAPVEKKKKQRLSDETVETIRKELEAGGKQSEIAKKYEIDPSTVSDIKCNRGRYAKKETPAPAEGGSRTPE